MTSIRFLQLDFWIETFANIGAKANTPPKQIVKAQPKKREANSPATNLLLPESTLHETWTKVQKEYFPAHPSLLNYRIRWSKRGQKRCLASCNPRKKQILVAHALAQPKCKEILEPLLYHEMCHAVLGEPQRINGRYEIHGHTFHTLEKRHPQTKHLNTWIKSGGWTNAKRTYTRYHSAPTTLRALHKP